MKVTTVGVDLVQNVFQLHGVDAHGKTVLKKSPNASRWPPSLSISFHT
jgi:hypothetical protein